MIPPTDVTIVVLAFREEAPCRPLRRWLRQKEAEGYRIREGPPESQPRDVARNQILREWLDLDTSSYLVMLNPWVVPVDDSLDRLLREPGDLLYSAVLGRYGTPSHWPRFDTAAFRLSRSLAARLPPRPFRLDVNSTGTRLVRCECHSLLALLPPGIDPIRVGRVGRLTPIVVWMDDGGRLRWAPPYITPAPNTPAEKIP